MATRLADEAAEILAFDDDVSAWEETLACEPNLRLTLEDEAIDRTLEAMGNFADLASPYLVGHSAGVAELATAAAKQCRLEAVGLVRIRRGALGNHPGTPLQPPAAYTPGRTVAAKRRGASGEPRPPPRCGPQPTPCRHQR